jgi:hypothetical protein
MSGNGAEMGESVGESVGDGHGCATATQRCIDQREARRKAASEQHGGVSLRRVNPSGKLMERGITYNSTRWSSTDAAASPYTVRVRGHTVYALTLPEATRALHDLLATHGRYTEAQKAERTPGERRKQKMRSASWQMAQADRRAKWPAAKKSAIAARKRAAWQARARRVAGSAPERARPYVRSPNERAAMRAEAGRADLPMLMWNRGGTRVSIVNRNGTFRAIPPPPP